MLGENFIKSLLALRAWQDGGQDGLSGCLAVCFVIRDRVRQGWYSGDWLQLLANHRQYSWTDAPYSDELPSTRNYAFDLLLKEIDGIFSGTRENDITQPRDALSSVFSFNNAPAKPVALYYGRLNDPNIREWFCESITRNTDNHRLIATVGSLSFFS
jgi:hypothetical protein